MSASIVSALVTMFKGEFFYPIQSRLLNRLVYRGCQLIILCNFCRSNAKNVPNTLLKSIESTNLEKTWPEKLINRPMTPFKKNFSLSTPVGVTSRLSLRTSVTRAILNPGASAASFAL